MDGINSLLDSVKRFIWQDDLGKLRGFRALLIRTLRMIYAVARELITGQLNLRAMSLVYTTLLSFVPLLAVSFSVLKGFGVHNQIEPLLMNFLEPLGARGAEITRNIIGFVENVKVGVLGSVGLFLLIYTVISLLQKIESAFNYVWHVDRLRTFSQRFSNYLSVILIGPVLVFSALGITASASSHEFVEYLRSVEPFGTLIVQISKLGPYMLVWLAFSFIYIFIPNTSVKPVSALIGGLVAGVMWQSTGWAFASFIASSSKYTAIYTSFAILILLLIWLYLSWLILLVGAQVAYYVQYPQRMALKRQRLTLSNRLREQLALQLMHMIARNHYHSKPPWTLEAMAQYLQLPMEPVHRVLRYLEQAGFLVQVQAEQPAYLPAVDIGQTRIADIIGAIQHAGEEPPLMADHIPSSSPVEALCARLQKAREDALGDDSVKSMIIAEEQLSEKK